MKRKNTLIKPTRIPPAADGIQVNYCKNPTCKNYGVPASEKSCIKPGIKDGYTLCGGSVSIPVLKCKFCGEFPPLKSNRAISEELTRLLSDLIPAPTPSCPDAQCTNHHIPVTAEKGHYQSYGMTHSGSKRYLCKACKKTFTVSTQSTLRQRQPEKNELIFKLLMNKSPMRRICEVADIYPETLYQRIDFFYEQCKAFAAAHEKPLLEGMAIPRLYIAVDRQEYTVNWSNQHDKRNVIMHAVGSADEGTGYVFGMHLDFDPSLNPVQVEADAIVVNDPSISHSFRRYARVWLKSDYIATAIQRTKKTRNRKKTKKTALMRDITTDVTDTVGARLKLPSPAR